LANDIIPNAIEKRRLIDQAQKWFSQLHSKHKSIQSLKVNF
jgi:hypothetical protein